MGTRAAPAGYLAPRWRGQPGRLEVWYTTLTDPATGTGVWLHHELVAPAPTAGDAGARAHGWAALFPPGETPRFARFGPEPWPSGASNVPFDVAGVRVAPGRLQGSAGEIAWDLETDDGGPPLFTFPRWAWERELLPAAHMVAAPSASFGGTIRAPGVELTLAGAPGATGRIYGRGNARRWAWLHAGLGGGDVLEVVAAVSTRPGLRALRPLPFLRLRLDGRDWPERPLAAAVRLRARVELPSWSIRGRVGDRRIRVDVTQPPEATLAVDYAGPDGRPAVCHNCERAWALIVLERQDAGRWAVERRWRLDGTAHAEVGLEPDQ